MPSSANPDPLDRLTDVLRGGLPTAPEKGTKALLETLFGARYQKRHFDPTMLRDAYSLAADDKKGGVPYAGLINPDNPPSGPYGGTSIVWFPTEETGSLIGLTVGTLGLSPDEGILLRPGHRRRIRALRRYLARLGVEAWTKGNPSAIDVAVPKATRDRFSGFKAVFDRYGKEMYCNAAVPRDDPTLARTVVQAFFDLYAYERGWSVLKAAQAEYDEFIATLRSDLFPEVDASDVHALLQTRRFVILQGPPGTGKTRMADEILREHFDGHGMTVQFHPAVTYEDFVVGLAPDATAGDLRFGVRRGWLLEAVQRAEQTPFLLVIDEVNRADLGKVLGEAIYLFEPGEVGGARARSVVLPHAVDGHAELALPENLYVLATMNTADRSIASLDLAIRRRFAFVTKSPAREVVVGTGLELAISLFDRLTDVFVEHAPEDALQLMPGHSYFLADSEDELRQRLRYELLPLLDEYLRQSLLGAAGNELRAVRDAIEDIVHGHS